MTTEPQAAQQGEFSLPEPAIEPGRSRQTVLDYRDAGELSQAEFLQRFPWPVLVALPGGPEKGGQVITTHGGFGSSTRFTAMRLSDLEGSELTNVRVMPLASIAQNPGRMLRLGRGDVCEWVFKLPMLSRVHSVVSSDGKGTFLVGDAGSKNGTYVDNRLLGAGEMVPLNDNALVTLGTLDIRFLSPGAFHAELRRMIAENRVPAR